MIRVEVRRVEANHTERLVGRHERHREDRLERRLVNARRVVPAVVGLRVVHEDNRASRKGHAEDAGVGRHFQVAERVAAQPACTHRTKLLDSGVEEQDPAGPRTEHVLDGVEHGGAHTVDVEMRGECSGGLHERLFDVGRLPILEGWRCQSGAYAQRHGTFQCTTIGAHEHARRGFHRQSSDRGDRSDDMLRSLATYRGSVYPVGLFILAPVP